MRRFFYNVIYQKRDKESSFDLGVFSSLKNARKKIEQAVIQPGFKDWIDGFKIVKFGVDFQDDIELKKQGLKLFCISHEYEINENDIIFDIFQYFDILSTIEEAELKVRFLKKHTHCGKKYPDGFEINTIIVDDYSCWSEGFTSY